MCSLWLPEAGSRGASRSVEFTPAKTAVQLALSLPESHGKLPIAGSGLKPILVAPFTGKFMAQGGHACLIPSDVGSPAALLPPVKPRLVGMVELRL